MIRAIVFLIKVGLLVALAVWIASRPGLVHIEWMDYKVNIQFGFFLLLALGAMLLAIFVYRIIWTLTDFPRSIRRYMELRRKEKGYMALTRGLAAVAAGDAKSAAYNAGRATKLLQGDTGLPLLLQAQAARLNGDENAAHETFIELTQNKDAAFFGVRGLLQAALDAHDYDEARELGHRALRMHPKQAWILKMVYDLEIRARDWEEAKIVLYRAEKAGAIASPQAASDRIAILLAQARDAASRGETGREFSYLQQAYRFHPYFPPAALALARYYKQAGNRRRAAAVIDRTWRKNPHPDLAKFWEFLIPPNKAERPMARVGWYEKLKSLNPASAESYIALGKAAMEDGLWGEARAHFEKAESIEPSSALYRLWMELEKRAPMNPRHREMLREKLSEFPLEKTWVCRETGAMYEEWHAIAEPHGAFNTIEWAYPHGSLAGMLGTREAMNDVLLEAPRGVELRASLRSSQ